MSQGVAQPRCRWLFFFGISLAAAGQVEANPAVPLVMVNLPGTSTTQDQLTGTVLRPINRSIRLRLIALSAMTPLMRQKDDSAQIFEKSSKLLEIGRQALVALDNSRAIEHFTQAAKIMREGFVEFYDPTRLAQIHLLLGVTTLQMARPDLARQEFATAQQLDPQLKLDAHYSPQVREAYATASTGLPPRPPPSVDQLQRLVAIVRADYALVLSTEPIGSEDVLVKGVLFERHKGEYTDVVAKTIKLPTSAATLASRELQALGETLKRTIESHLPQPDAMLASATSLRSKRVLPQAVTPIRPWYRRWYPYAIAGAVAILAITLPLATRQRYVDATFQWPTKR